MKINFSDSSILPQPLTNLGAFDLNDSLNIISGANGSGKTRLLEELERHFSGAYGGNKVVRLVAREDYNQSYDTTQNPNRVSELDTV